MLWKGSLFGGLCFLISCAVTTPAPDFSLNVPDRYQVSESLKIHDQWWKEFHDSELDQLIETALRDNFSIQIAWNRLDQSRALLAKANASMIPSLDSSSRAARSYQSNDTVGSVASTTISTGLTASYEVDLWGRVQSAVDAAKLDLMASEQDLKTAGISIASQVAQHWLQISEKKAQLKLIEEQLETNQKYLSIIQTRYQAGLVQSTDVLQQQQLIHSTQARRENLLAGLSALNHSLCVLIGKMPDEVSFNIAPEIPSLPSFPSSGIPAELILRRPDILASKYAVESADKDLAYAIADRLPQLKLTFSAETSAQALRDLFDNWLANLAANLAAPVVDGGRRKAEVERTRAIVSERLNQYRQAVLKAFLEVDDAVKKENHQTLYLEQVSQQLKLSEHALEQVLNAYVKGTEDFTRYLSAVQSYQSLQSSVLDAGKTLVSNRIDLYQALAGGFEMTRVDEKDAIAGGNDK